MFADRPFRMALVFSIGLHAVLFSPISSLVSRPQERRDTNIEITYIEIEEEKALDLKPMPVESPKVSLKDKLPSPPKTKDLTQDKAQRKEKEILRKVARIVKKDIDSRKEEEKKAFLAGTALDLNALSTHEGTSDSLNYLKVIRDKISLYVHKKYNTSMGEGDVLLHFVLVADGSVQSATILRGNLGNRLRLKNLCLDSVYHSSPFQPFPKDLGLNQAAFKINISFKRN